MEAEIGETIAMSPPITPEQWAALPPELQAVIEHYERRIAELEAETGRLKKTPRNSSLRRARQFNCTDCYLTGARYLAGMRHAEGMEPTPLRISLYPAGWTSALSNLNFRISRRALARG